MTSLGISIPYQCYNLHVAKKSSRAWLLLLIPLILIPAYFVILFVLAYNALGDGMRDAADPYIR